MSKQRVLILGAGISGLASAWYLKKAMGAQVAITILEKEERGDFISLS